ncbi:hypothetical protein [Streptomyces sp. NPDC048527]|uniref:hypothetical protein n=1 Tax=Streptomyces sp. NPDC048527 TaxID=3365568 RepID=UPI00371736E5
MSSHSGARWLLNCTPVLGGDVVAGDWDTSPEGLALVPIGLLFDVIHVRRSLGLTALANMHAAGRQIGPVLDDFLQAEVDVLVPADTADHWSCPSTTAYGRGRGLLCPRPGESYAGISWLVVPDGSGRLTDPRELESALRGAGA